MRAEEHPEYTDEKQRLDTTIQAIDEQLEPYKQRREIEAAYADASEALSHVLTHSVRQLLEARPKPYFGRFDFRRVGNTDARAFYIGKIGIAWPGERGELVYDWRAPIANLFYVAEFQGAEYKAPHGQIRGDVSLRRRYTIQEEVLVEISDERPAALDLVPAAQTASIVADDRVRSDEFLLAVLSQHRDARLHDIVATIQAQQNALIRAPLDRTLLIQGVAGSGKTSVALHRIAYLLYAYRDKLEPKRLAIIGPSRLFLQSISDVLPDLGVQGIEQTTFEAWAQAWIKPIVRLDSSDEPLERFLDNATDRQANVATFLRGRLKGSLRMKHLLRDHVTLLRQAFLDQPSAIGVTYKIPPDTHDSKLRYIHVGRDLSVYLTVDEVQDALRQSPDLDASQNRSLNTTRDRATDLIADRLWEKFKELEEASIADAYEVVVVNRRRAFINAVRSQVDQNLSIHWPRLTAMDCYKMLVTNRDQLEQVNAGPSMKRSGQLSEGEINLLLASGEHFGASAWLFEDLPILCYLDILLNGRSAPMFDHIVVDEAQDVSPLQVEVLRYHAKGGSMTLLGDIAQGVYSFRGIQKWSELRELFQSRQFASAKLAISYRSTYEITVLANKILAGAHLPEKVTALPVARHGPSPRLQSYDNWSELVRDAMSILNVALAQGAQSAAIICKTAAMCKRFATSASEIGVATPPLVLTTVGTSSPQFMLTPAYLAKGLEFDCIVVAGADAATFTGSEYDAKLLYVSVTRALHELHVLWVGEPAALLAPVVTALHRTK